MRVLAAMAVLVAALASAAKALNTDGLALLALKFAVSDDPGSALATWRDGDADPCSWLGVTCADGGGGRVAAVELANLSLAGYLPSELSLLSELQTLSLPSNRLSGQIPAAAIAALQNLVTLNLAHNFLTGQIPPGISRLASLSRLDLSSNQLNGTLPPGIAGLPRLSGVLNLSYNHFTGGIPPEFGGIPVAVSLDLRGNDLAGEIPQVGSLVNQGPTAFDDNPSLCGFPLKVECAGARDEPRIPQANTNGMNPGAAAAEVGRRPGKKRSSSPTLAILAVVVVAAIVAGLVLQWQCRRRCAAAGRDEEKESSASSAKEKKVSGAAGMTLAGSEERHHNGGAYYYAPDEKLLIYDYLANGSLHSALHGGPTASPTPLPWSMRLSIVQGAARGLAYLHECSPRRYVHGCIKSSKILLDDELRAHVSGFGLARLVVAGAHKAHSKKLACALRNNGNGAVPYVAPELRVAGNGANGAAAATQKGARNPQ